MDLDGLAEALMMGVELIKWIMLAASLIVFLRCLDNENRVGAVVSGGAFVVILIKVIL